MILSFFEFTGTPPTRYPPNCLNININELERIAFGDGPVAGKLKAMKLLGKHIGFFTPKKVPEVERTSKEILSEIYKRIEKI